MADPEIMKLYASLVEDPAIRDVMLERILNESSSPATAFPRCSAVRPPTVVPACCGRLNDGRRGWPGCTASGCACSGPGVRNRTKARSALSSSR